MATRFALPVRLFGGCRCVRHQQEDGAACRKSSRPRARAPATCFPRPPYLLGDDRDFLNLEHLLAQPPQVRKSLQPTKESLREAVSSMVFDPSMLCDDFLDRLVPLALKWMLIWKEPWVRFWSDGGRRNRDQYLMNGIHISELVHSLRSPPLIIWGRTPSRE